jgi:hypothetical protein
LHFEPAISAVLAQADNSDPSEQLDRRFLSNYVNQMLLNLETAAFGYFWTWFGRQNCAGWQNTFAKLKPAHFPALVGSFFVSKVYVKYAGYFFLHLTYCTSGLEITKAR